MPICHGQLLFFFFFFFILVTLTYAYVHIVGYACSVMPFSEIDVMCCIKCIMKCRECHACSSSSSAAIFQLFWISLESAYLHGNVRKKSGQQKVHHWHKGWQFWTEWVELHVLDMQLQISDISSWNTKPALWEHEYFFAKFVASCLEKLNHDQFKKLISMVNISQARKIKFFCSQFFCPLLIESVNV